MGGDPSKVAFRRVLAWVADSVLVLVVYWGGLTLLGVELEPDPAVPGQTRWVGDDSAVVMVSLLVLGYWIGTQVVLQGLAGWTPGKGMLGIRLAGWDGRPPGMVRAFAHSIVVSLATGIFGCLGGIVLLAFVVFNKYHRHPGDMLGGTYVIDAWSKGHVLQRTPEGLRAGPVAVTREDVVRELGAEAAARILTEPDVGGRSTEPVYDKERDTYVVWRERQQQWLQYDKASNTWVPLR